MTIAPHTPPAPHPSGDDTRRADSAHAAAATDVGRVRAGNEDSYALWRDEGGPEAERRWLLVVADGMGGAAAGELASRLTVETVVKRVRESATFRAGLLQSAVEEAHEAVRSRARSEPGLAGMGTTCTAVLMRGTRAVVAHVGDSRAYVVRGRRVVQLTDDHSLVAHLVRRREITPEQARRDSRRNILIRSVGSAERVEVDAFEVDPALGPEDTLVVCSDGLHGVISDSDLAAVVETASDLPALCRDLVTIANDAGGPDNITVVAARPTVEHPSASWSALPVRRWLLASALGVLFGIAAFAMFVGMMRIGTAP